MRSKDFIEREKSCRYPVFMDAFDWITQAPRKTFKHMGRCLICKERQSFYWGFETESDQSRQSTENSKEIINFPAVADAYDGEICELLPSTSFPAHLRWSFLFAAARCSSLGGMRVFYTIIEASEFPLNIVYITELHSPIPQLHVLISCPLYSVKRI